MKTDRFIKETPLLDYSHADIQRLADARNWREDSPYDRIGQAYAYVRDEIPFGYNISDELPASRVLADGIGQCNTKGTLLMALLRALDIPCRFHGFTIDKKLQKGAITGLAYAMAPPRIIHSWVEVCYKERWINLEGFILDRLYLERIQNRYAGQKSFCGFGVATRDLAFPAIDWEGKDTYIQKEGIVDDLGIYDDPDSFYRQHGSNLSGVKKGLYKYFISGMMTRNVRRIRENG
ncbi:MAG: transglutaminase family protein [Desulfobacterales bacterium]|nr:transglutaminase family protein [Desulfobacterales bacterium]